MSFNYVQIKVDPELKERFQAVVRGRRGHTATMSDVIRAFMLRECEKFEAQQRQSKWAEEEHNAKIAALARQAGRVAS